MADIKKAGTSAEGHEVSEVQESAALGSQDSKYKVEKITRLLPVHSVVGLEKGVIRTPGRPRTVERKPTTSDLEYHQEMAKEKAEFIEEDPIVKAIQGRVDTATLMQRLKEEVAREAAAIHFQSLESGKFGRDSIQASSRRIDALKRIAELELEIKKLGADTLDLRSERMQKLFQYIVAAFREGCVSTGMSPEQIDILFNRLSTNLEGWEEKAADLVR